MHAISAILLFVTSAGVLAGTAFAAEPKASDDAATILAMERAALDRWGKGDPDGFLEISAPDVVYFDPLIPRRINNLEELRKLYNSIRGKGHIDRYEIIDPRVEVSGDMALLTFNFVSHTGQSEMRWNTTEVFRRRDGQWRIIQTHWSLTQPKLAGR